MGKVGWMCRVFGEGAELGIKPSIGQPLANALGLIRQRPIREARPLSTTHRKCDGRGGVRAVKQLKSASSASSKDCNDGEFVSPSPKLNALVMSQLTEKIFTPERMRTLIGELRKRIETDKNNQNERVHAVTRQIKQVEDRQIRLIEAIETGVIEIDEITQTRMQEIKTARESLLIELAKVRLEDGNSVAANLKPGQVDVLCKVLREKLLSKDSIVAKSYLSILVDEIRLKDNAAVIQGGYAALTGLI